MKLFKVISIISCINFTNAFINTVGLKVITVSPLKKTLYTSLPTKRFKCISLKMDEFGFETHNMDQMISNTQNFIENIHITPTMTLIGTYVAFFFALDFITKFMGNQNNNPFAILNDSPGELIPDSNVTLSDVAGIDYVKTEVEEVISFITDREKYEKVGAKIPRGILLSSPPGCGKTLIARAIASSAKVPLLAASGSEFTMVYVGLGPKRVKGLFEKARKMAPCIIFLDEIDALASSRSSSMGNEERESTLNQFLVEMDGVDRNEGVVVIGATNRPDLLDSALMRSGRMDRKINIGLPREEDRFKILEVHAGNKILSPDVDLRDISKQTPGMSGADMENIMNEASIHSVRNGNNCITQQDVDEAFDKMTIGIRLPNISVPDEVNKIVCVHEAAHALVAYLQKDYPKISRISAVPTSGGAGGFTMFTPNEESFHSKERLLSELRVLLGGRAGEEIILENENITTGASNDLERARSVAVNIISTFSMGDSIAYTSQEEEIIIVSIINEAYMQALDLVNKNKELLMKVAYELIEKREMTGDRFYEIMSKYG